MVIFDHFCPFFLLIKYTFPFKLSILYSAFSINDKNERMIQKQQSIFYFNKSISKSFIHSLFIHLINLFVVNIILINQLIYVVIVWNEMKNLLIEKLVIFWCFWFLFQKSKLSFKNTIFKSFLLNVINNIKLSSPNFKQKCYESVH